MTASMNGLPDFDQYWQIPMKNPKLSPDFIVDASAKGHTHMVATVLIPKHWGEAAHERAKALLESGRSSHEVGRIMYAEGLIPKTGSPPSMVVDIKPGAEVQAGEGKQ